MRLVQRILSCCLIYFCFQRFSWDPVKLCYPTRTDSCFSGAPPTAREVHRPERESDDLSGKLWHHAQEHLQQHARKAPASSVYSCALVGTPSMDTLKQRLSPILSNTPLALTVENPEISENPENSLSICRILRIFGIF